MADLGMRRALLAVVCVAFLFAVPGAEPHAGAGGSLPVRPAATPPMGWNSWNSFGCSIDENKVHAAADALVSSGMRDAGYRYVVVDDCWFSPQRDSSGELRANPDRFPHGMAALGEYLHARGLRFGLYMSPNLRTCAQVAGDYPGNTGSGGHERTDAREFASWGVDYLKYDWCHGASPLPDVRAAFTTMRDALAATGRPVLYSINPNSNHPGEPGENEDWRGVAHMVRTTEDIEPLWFGGNHNAEPMGVRDIIDVNAALAHRAGPGHWNDPDMLEVGVSGGGYPGLSADEARTHLSMWAMMAAPLIAGNEPAQMSPAERDLLTRREVLAVDQDPLGRPARRVVDGDQQVWVRPLREGTAVALYNRGDQPAEIGTSLAGLGLPAGQRRVHDLWQPREWTTGGAISAAVPAHGTVLLRLDPA